MKRAKFYLLIVILAINNPVGAQKWKQYADSALIYQQEEEVEKATPLWIRAKENLPSDSLYSVTSIFINNTIGDNYFLLSQNSKAAPFYIETLQGMQRNYSFYQKRYAGIADTLGQIYFNGDASKAAFYFLKAKNIRDTVFGKSSALYANSCNNLGNLYGKIGKYDSAEILYRESKAIREKLFSRTHPDYAQSCNNLSDVLRKTGHFEEAEPLALEAIAIRAKLAPEKQHRLYAISCNNLANLYKDMGQFEKAAALYIEAKDIRAKIKPEKLHASYAETTNALAGLYYQMGEPEKAEALYFEVKKIRENNNGTQSFEYAQILNNLALLYLDGHMIDKAEPLAFRANEIWRDILAEDDPSLTINNNLLGSIYQAKGDYTKAISYLMQAREQWKKTIGSDHPSFTQNAMSLASIYWKKNEVKKASKLYSEAFQLQYQQIRKLFRFTNELEKEQFLKNINGSGDEMYSFQYSKMPRNKAGEAYTISLLNRNLILESSIGLKEYIFKNKDTSLANKYQQWNNIKKQISLLYSRNDGLQVKQIATLEEAADKLEKELTRNMSATTIANKVPVNWKQIQKKLSSTEAAIEFIEFQYYDGKNWTDSVYYAALVLRKDRPEPVMVPLFETRTFDNFTKELNNGSGSDAIGLFYTRGAKIGNATSQKKDIAGWLWKPLETYLAGIDKIFFAPVGKLHRISFAALPINDKQLLSEKYQLVQLNTTASILLKEELHITKKDQLVVYGAIDYDSTDIEKNESSLRGATRAAPYIVRGASGFDYLPGTLTEIEAVQKIGINAGMKVNVLKGKDATENSFKAMDMNTGVAVIHLATHGYYFPEASVLEKGNDFKQNRFQQSIHPLLRSGVVLAGANFSWKGGDAGNREDGILTGLEVANLYLPNTKLVVLSACETALGDIKGTEGVYGLQRAFKMVGVKYLLMSLWEVPDTETAEFMELLYKNLLAQQSIENAFKKTQHLMQIKYRNEPYKWGAWVLIY